MQTDAKPAEKRTAVEYLSFDKKTAKRAEWEAFEFTIVGPHLVEVANASYGFEKADHTYTVGVAVRDGVAFPAECECPADIHREQDCKHKVALALIGNPVVLDAARTCSRPVKSGEAVSEGSCPNGDSDCDGPGSGDLPCWPCYRADV
ncbi:hypothetical protein [Salinirussus salinus]|uniref:hypothetical protein n=1 Tax=Salinirussus salinus TaxID=1198300 RepID=UPI00135B2747|nr:hypothetical protein [Salinirussus salinus]